MEITSIHFVLLSIVSVFIYYVLKNKYKILFLTIVSCAFVATYSYYLLLYVIGYSLINYYIGIKIVDSRFRNIFFKTGIIFNLSQLLLLKYVSFTVNPLLQLLNIDLNLLVISKIIIPVGISFFTLQGIGYLVNLNMGWEKSEKNFIHFLLYIIFFPRFLAGPIDRSNHFLPQLKITQSFNEQRVADGFRLVLIGLFKKVAIANQLAPVIINAYANLNSTDVSTLWMILLLQPLYLYFDFSGYTDIAFGFARALGIELRPNFKQPFMAENMTNFWKRFHISLSSWFHDYIFMRMIFKYRKWGKNASTFALFVTWMLFGIWHGSGWTFMLLGLLQGIAIFYEFSTKKWRTRIFARIPIFYRKWMGRIITYLFYGTSLVFFFAPNLSSVRIFFSKLFPVNGVIPDGINKGIFILIILFAFIFIILEIIRNDYVDTSNSIDSFWYGNKKWNKFSRWALYFSLITIVLVFNNEVQEFIYFQF